MEIVASWPSHSSLAEVGGFARQVEDLGFDVLHVPETIHDPFTVAALAVQATSRLVVRTSMVVAFPRSPMVTAYAAWDLAKLSGGRFQLGVASQVRGNIVGRFSTEWSEPVARLEDYIASLRAIFACFQDGGPLLHEGPHYRFDRLQPYFNPGPLPPGCAPPTIWTGGVGPDMCAMAGRVADGFVAHPTGSHPRMLKAEVLPALVAGAGAAGRPSGPFVVAGPQPLLAATSGELASVRDARRQELAFLYSTPAYRRQLSLFGLEEVGQALSEMAGRGDWSDLGRHLTDEVIAELVPQGTYAELPTILDRWYAGLVHGLVLGVPDDGTDSDAFRDLVARCRSIRPAAREPL